MAGSSSRGDSRPQSNTPSSALNNGPGKHSPVSSAVHGLRGTSPAAPTSDPKPSDLRTGACSFRPGLRHMSGQKASESQRKAAANPTRAQEGQASAVTQEPPHGPRGGGTQSYGASKPGGHTEATRRVPATAVLFFPARQHRQPHMGMSGPARIPAHPCRPAQSPGKCSGDELGPSALPDSQPLRTVKGAFLIHVRRLFTAAVIAGTAPDGRTPRALSASR